jgi:hypothetical protein
MRTYSAAFAALLVWKVLPTESPDLFSQCSSPVHSPLYITSTALRILSSSAPCMQKQVWLGLQILTSRVIL